MSLQKNTHLPHLLKIFYVVLILLHNDSISLFAQEEPRYNRIQYRKFHWNAWHGSKFNIYFPADAADSLFRFVFKEMPDAITHIKKATIHDVPNGMNIIIYPSVDQVYESNIGGYEPTVFTFPTFASRGNRIVLAYNGSYANLIEQMYEGLARVLWETQLKEVNGDDKTSDSKKPTENKLLPKGKDIPFWYKEGSIRYFAHGWTIAAEDKLKINFEQNTFTGWQQVINYAPRLAGHAFCYFLTQNYYHTAVAQTFFQLKKKKSLPRALRLITKQSMDSLYAQCFDYYSNRFVKDSSKNTAIVPDIVLRHKKGIVSKVLLNGNNDLVAYISLANNRRTVHIYDIKNRTTKKITSYNLVPWIDEHSPDQYPLIELHKDGRQLYIAKPRKGKIDIKRYTANGNMVESTALYGVDGITSMHPISDRDFLITAYRKGQSDVVSYNENSGKYTPYTDDEYDDAKAVFTGNGNELLFISERPEKYEERKTYLIGVGYKKDILWQGVYTNTGNGLKPVAIDSTWYIKWDKPVLLQNNKLLLTSTKFGTEKNVVLNHLNGAKTNLGEYRPMQYQGQSDKISLYTADKDSIYITQKSLNEWIDENTIDAPDASPWLIDYNNNLAKQAREDSILKKAKDTTHFMMDDVFASKPDKKKPKRNSNKSNKNLQNRTGGVKPYMLQLHGAYFSAKVNNDYFINRYQPYRNYMGQFKFPEISGMTKGGFTDLLENHHFTIAYTLPVSTEGSTFFARYENTEKKIDWGLSYFRKVETLKSDPARNWVDENGNKYPQNAKDKIHYYELFLKKPLTYDCSLGVQIAVRQDKTVFLATDKYSLRFPPINSAWSINTLSFNLNKLRPTIPYLNKGCKVSALFDLFNGFGNDAVFLFGSSINIRHDFPIYKYITLVAQVHAGYSGGEQHVLYNLGGEDNNVTPRVDTSVHFPQNAPYAFQTLVTPFRGYYQNSLYGNQYALLNVDVYFPIFQTLIPIETPLPFINNLQLGLLNDIATARETWNDQSQGSKWLWSNGLSARTVLAGYPLRLEVAWPGTFRKEPVWYFSLNLQ